MGGQGNAGNRNSQKARIKNLASVLKMLILTDESNRTKTETGSLTIYRNFFGRSLEMRIIESEEGSLVAKSFERALPVFGIEKNMPLILVNADIDFLGSDKKMNEIVDEIEDDKERPVIFYSFDSQEKLEIRRHPASRLFYKSDVGFVKMPVELIELKKLYDFLVSGKKIANPAVEAFLSLGVKEHLANILLHDIGHPHLTIRVLDKAKEKFGITGSAEEVREKLKQIQQGDQKETLAKEWKGKTFPGVFCDIEGTLFFVDKIKNEVLEKLNKYAETTSVTLWSGGDLEEIEKKLVANGVSYPLVSKYAFEG
ncbi:MAG: hypothetical protein AAB736_02895, partial [Patescibacteria group bacterium]